MNESVVPMGTCILVRSTVQGKILKVNKNISKSQRVNFKIK